MISKKYRFHGYGSLKFLFSKGRAVHGPDLTIKYVANPRRKNPRFAVIVSKKVHKSAVVRNRIRRRIYELIRLNLPQIDPIYDIAIIARKDTLATLDHDKLSSQIGQLFRKANLLK